MHTPVTVTIRYLHNAELEEISIVSSDPKEIAIFMARSLRNWIIDEDIEIVVDGENR